MGSLLKILILSLLSYELFAQTSVVAVGEASIEKLRQPFQQMLIVIVFQLQTLLDQTLECISISSLYDSDLSELEDFDYEFRLAKRDDGEF